MDSLETAHPDTPLPASAHVTLDQVGASYAGHLHFAEDVLKEFATLEARYGRIPGLDLCTAIVRARMEQSRASLMRAVYAAMEATGMKPADYVVEAWTVDGDVTLAPAEPPLELMAS